MPAKIFVASSNPGKLREYRELARATSLALEAIQDFGSLPHFEESAPTFAENAAGKALHYSRFAPGPVIADDSGLVVAALGGAPGVHSARYAGTNATDAQRVDKLLREMRGKTGGERSARFICVVALAERGEVRAVISDSAEGQLLASPRGSGGFGYDPIFFLPHVRKTFAEISGEEKNALSHRGKAFFKLARFLAAPHCEM
ncbi:MAG: RdgB/HAM1 family non-canonical purine NTP pyrophosphatase [Candidatus Acidiferrales bacterium]